jgi:hypothetical protein
MHTHNTLVIGTALFALMALPFGDIDAQRMVTAQVGVGAALDKRNDRLDGTHRHIAAAVEVTPPLIPLGLRGDAMWIDAGATGGTVALSVNAVFTIKLPIVRPYALAGWGQYGVGGSAPRSGANAGAGVRVSAGPVRLFGEVRRHWPLSRDLVTVGLSL